MKKIIFLCLSIFIIQTTLFAHKEWVHQHIIWESYKFLKNQIGHDIPEFQNRMIYNDFNSGNNNTPWSSGRIDVAGWREDSEDPLWGCGEPFYGWDPSSTHFWNADNGEDAETWVPLSPSFPNAWFKARTYLGIWNNLYDYTDIFIQAVSFDPEYGQILGRFYRYWTLQGLYNTGSVYCLGYVDLNLTAHWFNPSVPVTLTESSRKNIAMGILGRVCHLLADMSAPAHIHNDLHPCNIIFLFHDGDYYELYLGTNLQGACDNLQTTFPAQNYTATTAANQGGLLYEIFAMNASEALRYLFYTQSQLSDHFKSEVCSISYPDHWGNNTINYDDNYCIDHWYSILGPPETSGCDSPTQCEFRANVLMNFTIRATATLMYWIAGWANIENCCPLVPDNASITHFSNNNNSAVFPQVASRYNFTLGPNVEMENNSFLQVYSRDIDLTADFSARNGSFFTMYGWNFPIDNYRIKKNTLKAINHFDEKAKDKNLIYEKYEEFLKQEIIRNKSIDALRSFVRYCLNKTSSIKPNQNKITMSESVKKSEQNKEKQSLIKKEESIKNKIKSVQDLKKGTRIDKKDIKRLDFEKIKEDYGLDSIINFLNICSVGFKEIPESEGIRLNEYLNYFISQVDNIADTLKGKNILQLPREFSLLQNYPNPFNPVTTINYAIPKDVNVVIEVYNVLGQYVQTLKNEFQKTGYYSIVFDGSNLSSGVYFYRFQAGDYVQKKKMVIIR